jgi:hypothetical protein
VPKAKGGSDRVSNLTLACAKCNEKKSSLDLDVFLAKKPELVKKIKAQAKAPLKDAAAVNSSRWAIYNQLKSLGLPISVGSGGQTKYNRTRFDIPKDHALDAACIGKLTGVSNWEDQNFPLSLKMLRVRFNFLGKIQLVMKRNCFKV